VSGTRVVPAALEPGLLRPGWESDAPGVSASGIRKDHLTCLGSSPGSEEADRLDAMSCSVRAAAISWSGRLPGAKCDCCSPNAAWSAYFEMCIERFGVEWMVSLAAPASN